MLSRSLSAKNVSINIEKGAGLITERVFSLVDPNTKVWVLKNFIFRNYGLDSNKYIFGQESAYGNISIDITKKLGYYGDCPEDSVKFVIYLKD